MWKIISALITGQFGQDLELLKIGPCSHSRWLTTACRICRLYACTKNPSHVLITLTAYIVNVYAPMWFTVKYQEKAISGPKNLFFLMKRSELMEDSDARKIVQRCIQRNAFFAHPENILLSQLASAQKSDRIDAVQTIIKAREKNEPLADVRLFRVPPLDFKATKWQLMIKWTETDIYEPPLVRNISNAELLAVVATPFEVPGFKCHIQMAERAVKEVTKASQRVVGLKRRDATIKTAMEHRTKYPKQESKNDFRQK